MFSFRKAQTQTEEEKRRFEEQNRTRAILPCAANSDFDDQLRARLADKTKYPIVIYKSPKHSGRFYGVSLTYPGVYCEGATEDEVRKGLIEHIGMEIQFGGEMREIKIEFLEVK